MLILVVLFIVVPLAELYVIIRVGQWIGAGPTIAVLLIDSVLGALLLRSQGRTAWRRFNQALSERRGAPPRPPRPSYDVEGSAQEVPEEPGTDPGRRPTLPP